MRINSPCIITPRLLPGVKIGDSFLSIEYGERKPEGRKYYRQGYILYLNTPQGEYVIDDVSSGICGGSLQEGLASCLSFMGACAEARDYRDRTGNGGENYDLFEEDIGLWCQDNSGEIDIMHFDLEEGGTIIEED